VIQWSEGHIVDRGRRWAGALELTVLVDRDGRRPRRYPAVAYPELVGDPRIGDRVLLNVNAVERGLGTGGHAVVVALPDRVPPWPEPGPGHLVKARYTPLQTMVLGVDAQESAHHDLLRDADHLDAMPVVVADLHSSLPGVIAGIRDLLPRATVAYVMTDGGALAAWYSRTVAGLREAHWLDSCITTGQSFGGDIEAVTVHTGLLAARLVVGADVAIVAQGPGNLGTGTRWGFSGVSVGETVNAIDVLDGRPVACLRMSQADTRERHRGISHHSRTAYGRVARARADVVLPRFPPGTVPSELADLIDHQVRDLVEPRGRHHLVEEDTDGLVGALDTCPVPLSTMGRGPDEDPVAFLAAAAAGRHAARLTTAAPGPSQDRVRSG
jgi:hypothetical protein